MYIKEDIKPANHTRMRQVSYGYISGVRVRFIPALVGVVALLRTKLGNALPSWENKKFFAAVLTKFWYFGHNYLAFGVIRTIGTAFGTIANFDFVNLGRPAHHDFPAFGAGYSDFSSAAMSGSVQVIADVTAKTLFLLTFRASPSRSKYLTALNAFLFHVSSLRMMLD